MASQSYRERLKAQRAEALAKRNAEKAEWHRRAELRYEIRKLAMDTVKAGIRARGDKLSLYSHAQLVAQANAMIGPWLVEQAKRQIAERNSRKLHKSRRLDSQALSVCRCHAQVSLGKMFLQNDLSVSARSLKAACAIVMLFGDPGMLVTEQCACEVSISPLASAAVVASAVRNKCGEILSQSSVL
jgi:hypothetical protein